MLSGTRSTESIASSSSAAAPAGSSSRRGSATSWAKRKKAHVTLIEKKRNHFWKPHLHEIAAGSMDIGVYQTNYLAQAHWHHFRYRIGEMIGLDRAQRDGHGRAVHATKTATG